MEIYKITRDMEESKKRNRNEYEREKGEKIREAVKILKSLYEKSTLKIRLVTPLMIIHLKINYKSIWIID